MLLEWIVSIRCWCSTKNKTSAFFVFYVNHSAQSSHWPWEHWNASKLQSEPFRCQALISQWANREEVQGEEAERIQSAGDNKQTSLPACCYSNIFASSLKVALAPRDRCSWVTKREGKWEESISWNTGSYPIVIKKAGVSLETLGYPCERVTHTHRQSDSRVKTHTRRGHWGRKKKERQLNWLVMTPAVLTSRKKGVAHEECCQEGQLDRYGHSYC